MMFRGCYFKFAGKSSELYNLILIYKDNENDNFNSGGEFNLRTDSVIGAHSQLLYGKDYSETPLEFVVEIVTPEGNIPMERMISIKNWLYGQDGWRDLTIIDDTQKYHLKCVLIPMEDITDVHGYRGVRCTIHNASPFWYGNEKSFVHNSDFNISNTLAKNYHHYVLNIPDNNYVRTDIYPTIVIEYDRSKSQIVYDYGRYISIENTTAKTVAEAIQVDSNNNNSFVYPTTSRIKIDTAYITDNAEEITYSCVLNTSDNKYYIQLTFTGGGKQIPTGKTEQPTQEEITNVLRSEGYQPLSYDAENYSGSAIYVRDTIIINTQYAIVKSMNYPNVVINPILDTDDPKRVFSLNYGTNVLRVHYPWAFNSITLKHTPLLRMGAF